VCLGKVSAHTKEEEKKEKTEFHPPDSQNKNKNWDLHIFSHNVLITLLKVLLRLCIGASVHPSQGSYVHLQ
jgi:hypothetical protein